MEIFPLVLALLKQFWWLIPLLLIAAYFKSPSFKGRMGERSVRKLIADRFDPTIYREFADVTIPTDDGTTQIDHVYVSPFGVFVLETKKYGGWIFGSKNQAQWTQTIYRSKHKFQNPLRQNYKHIKSLEHALQLPLSAFKSVVVFTGDCTFKTEMPDEICTLSDLVEYLRSIDNQILSEVQIEEACATLNSLKLDSSFQTHRKHVKHLRRKHG